MYSGAEGSFFNLLAQTVDVNGDGYVVAHALKPPDHLVQILAAENLIRVAQKKQ